MRFNAPIVTGALAALASFAPLTSATLLAPKTQPQPRGEICAYVDADLKLNHHNYGKVDVCLCVGSFGIYLSTSAVVKAALNDGHSIGGIEAALDVLITESLHRMNFCPGGSGPSHKKRSPAELARVQRQCDGGLTKCGVVSHAAAAGRHYREKGTSTSAVQVQPYECIDTKTNLESCGGCVVSYTFGLTPAELFGQKEGVDCTTLDGVSDVDCFQGRCVVHRCSKGYALVHGADGNSEECVRIGDVPSGEMHQQVGGTIVWKKDVTA